MRGGLPYYIVVFIKKCYYLAKLGYYVIASIFYQYDCNDCMVTVHILSPL
jgi:hypothetical protein